ncbi:hypothetical protein AWB98_01200 [Mycolicibacterium conceptionense]|nr:hypothetical protein [Mycolicibacterium conceptionense]ORV20944.1 hypothetical protein AWB98_01200 [Mycolicibacterium conceptionense]
MRSIENPDLALAIDRAIDAAITHTVETVTALVLCGDWAKSDAAYLDMVGALAVLKWELEKPRAEAPSSPFTITPILALRPGRWI